MMKQREHEVLNCWLRRQTTQGFDRGNPFCPCGERPIAKFVLSRGLTFTNFGIEEH
jgi:hypothetical protein